MKKNFVSASGFDAALTRELKASDRLFCRVYDGDERIYITNGYFAVALLPQEYDALARPVFQTDAGNLHMDRKHGCNAQDVENVMDIRKILTDAAHENIESLQRAPFIVPTAGIERTGKAGLAFCYDSKNKIVSAYNANYFEVFKAHALKAKNALSGAVAFAGDDVVGLLLPVRFNDKPERIRALRAVESYYTEDTKQAAPVVDKTTAELQAALDAKSHANRALNNELNAERDKFHELEQHNAANVKALEAAQKRDRPLDRRA